MKCKFCKEEKQIYWYLECCCESCHESIFELKNYRFVSGDSKILVVWTTEIDNQLNKFNIYFRYDESKTVFTRIIDNEEKVVLTLNETMPLTEAFLRKARNNIRLWQVFS